MEVLSIPNNIDVSGKVQMYQAQYARKGSTLTAHRIFTDSTPTSVCSPEISAEYTRLGGKITENLQEQVLYK